MMTKNRIFIIFGGLPGLELKTVQKIRIWNVCISKRKLLENHEKEIKKVKVFLDDGSWNNIN